MVPKEKSEYLHFGGKIRVVRLVLNEISTVKVEYIYLGIHL